jgi:catechol 2,3-dioxygenase-like lactoylglutathione lyase family enzyme
MNCCMDHIVINMEDSDGMIDFYTSILGLSAERLEEYFAGTVPFPSVRISSETIIDLFPKHMWQKGPATEKGMPNLNHFCLSLDKKDWDDLVGRLNASGIKIEDGPVPRWGAHGTGTSIYFRDPEGNLIEARYYKNQANAEKCLLVT